MNNTEITENGVGVSPLSLLKKQRSHVLLVLSNALSGQKQKFTSWYKGDFLQSIIRSDHVLSAQHFQQCEIDITGGKWPAPDYQYLGVYELSLDGAEESIEFIDKIFDSYKEEESANVPATWLYYPISEKVGRSPTIRNPLLVLAFANSIPGSNNEFREWYSTRHIRHALNIPVFVSGQCFELTDFQHHGGVLSDYSTIAIYEQEGSPQDFIDSLELLSAEQIEQIQFPTLDAKNFGEAAYCPID